ncbi:cyclase family protein [Nitrococcus mobilis]|uniref:Putative cyclase n=1 Tax=Nitrococcus mobilis Nb-231 TaxID=314278 RepID=A4BTL6_9GAMM|nr:cyclase family protein [Nitrococcus mobilis]EAR20972.1 Putative cyclase [Nitrococcus mobilis Nb-231]
MSRTPITLGAIFACALGLGNAKAEIFANGRWIDLSHAFSAETIYWPTAEPFKRETVFAGTTQAGYYYSAYNFSAAEHGGTHIDAPVHFAEGQRSVDEIPVGQLIGPAAVIDVAQAGAADRDYQVTADDFKAWEAEHGRLPDGAIVLLNTGSAKCWPNREAYMGTAQRGEEAVAKLHFPGLYPEAARWLVHARAIGAIGLDTPSIDYGQSKRFESHRILFKAGVPAFENVTNLNALPATGATAIALPMKIEGGSGGPLRIVAFVPAS